MIFSSRNFTLRHQEEQGHSKQHFAQPNIQCYHLQFQPSTKHWKTDTIQSRPLPTGWSFLQCPITGSSFLSETSSEWAVPSMLLPTFCARLLMYSLRRLRLPVQLPSFLSKTSLELSLMVHSQQYGLIFQHTPHLTSTLFPILKLFLHFLFFF